MQCLDQLAEQWATRMQDALAALSAGQGADVLRLAQEHWTAYRRANCSYYRQRPGSIAAIEAAECMCVLTKRRALELEAITNPEAAK